MTGNSSWIIPLCEVPANLAIHQYILKETDLSSQMEKIKCSSQVPFRALKMDFDFQKLRLSVLEGIKKYGQYQFQYGREGRTQEGIYLSTSLTSNSNAYDKTSDDPHQATLGSKVLKWNSAIKYEENSDTLFRNSYHDTLSFAEKTPLSEFESIGEFLNTFERTLIRSRISTVVANKEETTRFGFNWHNDEHVFINLRINIPIQTSPNYVIQILQNENEDSLKFEEFSMKESHAYVYDTHKFHRAVCKQMDTVDRIHMICGVSPWFDFDEKNKAWKSNEYYGKIHPFDMFEEGLIAPVFKK